MTTPRTFRYCRKLSVGGGDPAWSVEAADAEARRLRKHGANACNRLLALLRAHHPYGTGELMLKGGRSRLGALSTLALSSKYLARSNKSAERAETTKGANNRVTPPCRIF
jgi:hypothetical protein